MWFGFGFLDLSRTDFRDTNAIAFKNNLMNIKDSRAEPRCKETPSTCNCTSDGKKHLSKCCALLVEVDAAINLAVIVVAGFGNCGPHQTLVALIPEIRIVLGEIGVLC